MFCIISPVFTDRVFFITTIISRQFTYSENERLKSRKQIEYLFAQGKNISIFPIKVLFEYVQNTAIPIQAGMTVSSRKFKKAVDRNRVKRIMREAYRLQKIPLQNILTERNISLATFFIYTGKELPAFRELHKKMGIILHQLKNEILKLPLKN